MKRLSSILFTTLLAPLLALVLTLPVVTLTGCAGFGPNQLTAAQHGAKVLTREILIENPAAKPKFDKALVELAELQKLEVITTFDLLAIVNRIPNQSRTIRLAVDGVTLVIYSAGNPTVVPAQTTVQLRQVAGALEAGIKQGFAEVPI